MANIVIRDLEVNQELDKKARENLHGGAFFTLAGIATAVSVVYTIGKSEKWW